MTPRRLPAALAALALLVLAAGSPAHAQTKKPAAAPAVDYAERFATVCAACHGANGRSELPGTPVLAGQYSFYTITQLFLYREGRRPHEAMIALTKGMQDADLRGFSDFIGTLPTVPAPPRTEPPDAELMRRGRALAHDYKCTFCHGAELDGGQQVPRIGGQKEDYLRQTLKDFKSGKRPGYTRAMTESLSQVPVEDLDLLAYFVAHFTGR